MFDPVGGFGDRANRRFVQRGFDRVGMNCQFADGANDPPMPQSVESAITISGEIALHGGAAG